MRGYKWIIFSFEIISEVSLSYIFSNLFNEEFSRLTACPCDMRGEDEYIFVLQPREIWMFGRDRFFFIDIQCYSCDKTIVQSLYKVYFVNDASSSHIYQICIFFHSAHFIIGNEIFCDRVQGSMHGNNIAFAQKSLYGK